MRACFSFLARLLACVALLSAQVSPLAGGVVLINPYRFASAVEEVVTPESLGLKRWSAEGFSGGTIADSGGSGQVATAVNSPTLIATASHGRPSIAMVAGSEQHFTIPDQVFGTGDYTYSVVLERSGGTHGFLGNASNQAGIALNFGGVPALLLDASENSVQTRTLTRSLTKWSVITVVRQSGVTSVYSNGALIERSTGAAGNILINRIGSHLVGGFFSGEWSEVMLKVGGLSASELRSLHAWVQDRYGIKVFTDTSDTNIVVIGDSNSLGYGTPEQGKAGWGWPYQLARLYQRTTAVYNGGVNGAKISTYPLSTAQINALAVPGKTNILLLALGTNDLQDGTLSVADFVTAYKALCGACRASYDVIKIVPIPPRSDGGTDASYDANRLDANAQMAAAAGVDHDGAISLWSGLITSGAEEDTRLNIDKCHWNEFANAIVAAQGYTSLTGETGATLPYTTGLLMDLDAESAGADGALVSTWDGGPNDVAADSGEEPVVEADVLMGRKAVKWSSGKRMVNSSMSVGTSYTIIAAYWRDASADQEWIYTDPSGKRILLFSIGNEAKAAAGHGGSFNDSGTTTSVTQGAPITHGLTNNGATLQAFAGGVIQEPQDGTTEAYTGCVIGSTPSGGTYFKHPLFRLLVFGGVVPAEDLLATRRMFAIRYGTVYEEP